MKKEIYQQTLIEHQQFISGLIQSITNFCDCMNPLVQNNTFECFSTDTYKFHYYQSQTNLRFVLLTEVMAPPQSQKLQEYYLNFYVPSISKNQLYDPKVDGMKCQLLDKKTEEFFRSLL